MTSVVFHSQLASIMDVLAKAAVGEICKLVDDGYAVLRLEISRGQKENQTLKRRLQTMELMIARGSAESEVAAGEGSVNSLCDGVMMWEDEVTPSTNGSLFSSMARPFDSQLGIRVWKDGDAPSVDKNPTVQPTIGKKSVDKAERRKESQPIKEERLEEDLEHGGLLEKQRTDEERVKLVADGGEASPIVDAQIQSVEGKEELPGQHRTRSSIWEDGGLDTDLKKEPENESVNDMLQDAGSEDISGKLNNLGYQYVISERPSQLETFFTQASTETETENPACSYTTEADSESLPISSELQSIPTAWEISSNSLSSAESISVKQGTVTSIANWELPLHNMCALPPQMTTLDDIAGSKSNLSDVGQWDPYNKGLIPEAKVHYRGGTGELFICTHCGKSFTSQNVFETHQRVHMGEKPFKCSLCEKRFSQFSNLITHRRVHTGEKPYRCSHCGKQFAQSRYLVTHQRVHTGEKPFRCTQCGKRFAQSNNLIRHQSVHTGQKPFRCSQCGKSFTTSSHRKRHESVHNAGKLFTSKMHNFNLSQS